MTTTSLEQAFVAELPFLRALARRLTSEHEADDLVHDAWLDAARAPSTAIASPRALLGAVLRNRARMTARQRERRRVREQADTVAPAAPLPPDAASELAQLLRALADAVDALPQHERRVLAARFVGGDSSATIAQREGTTDGAVRSRIRRSLDQIRNAMDRRSGGRDAWAWAVLPLMPPAPAIGGTALVMTMGWMTKTMATVAVVGALSAAWLLRPRRPANETQDAPPPTQASTPSRAGADASTRAQPSAPAREIWQRRRDDIEARRAQRRAAAQSDRTAIASARAAAPRIAPDGDAGDTDALTDALGRLAAQLGNHEMSVLAALMPQLVESVRDCVELVPPGTSGTLRLGALVLAEPDVGTIVEQVQSTEDTVGGRALQECVTESIYAFDLPALDASLTRSFGVTIDLDGRTIAADTELTLEQLQAMIAADPSLAEVPEIAEALAQAQAQSAAAP